MARSWRKRLGESEYRLIWRVSESATGRVLRRATPRSVRRAARFVLGAPTFASLAKDPRSFALLARMNANSAGGNRDAPAVSVRLRPLGSRPALLRPGTADVVVARDMFVSSPHLAPDGILREPPRRVWDLGAHIGLAAMHFAVLYPAAHITAVELEHSNAGLCRSNLAQFGDRCEVVEGAIWVDDGELRFELGGENGGTNAFRVAEETQSEATGMETARALSLNSLLKAAGAEGRVDYCKMDIEGAERQVLRHNTGWAASVETILVEVHRPYTAAECQEDLERLGFQTWTSVHDRPDVVVGSRL